MIITPDQLISIGIGAGVAIASAIVTIISWKKSHNAKKALSDGIELFNLYENKITEFMMAAEDLALDGASKKEVVKTKIQYYCVENGILYNEELVNTLIEKLIDFSKVVNSRTSKSARTR